MANHTDPAAKSMRGTNPQNLVEKILRSKIYQNTYWKEQCFGLTAETLVDKAMKLDHLGGTYGGNRKPTPFMCLVMKMLQIQPEKEIVIEFIKNDDYKEIVRILGAFYLRLTGTDTEVYRYLEPLYNDYRKLRRKLADGQFTLTHVDEVIDELLTKDYSCDIALPRIKKRWTLESLGSLELRQSALEEDFEEQEEKEDNEQPADELEDRERERRERDRDRGRRRSYSRSRSSRSRDRKEHDGGDYRKRHARSSVSPRRHGDGPEDGEPKKKKEKKEKKDDGTNHPDPEIAEANKLRAALGLKPLKF